MMGNELSTECVFNILSNLLIGNEIVYVSTPINTGERYINWCTNMDENIRDQSNEYLQQRALCVIKPNISNAKKMR